MITYVSPLVAVLLDVGILSEPLTLGIPDGMPLILLGSMLGTASALQRAGPTPGERDADPATVSPASPPTP